MPRRLFRIMVVAPAARIDPSLAERVVALAEAHVADRAELVFHPQCFLSSGHFAGTDAERAHAFAAAAEDPEVDAVWCARGGYGSARIAERVVPKLGDAARGKRYLGYSDVAFLFAGLYASGLGGLAHGPMPSDLNRDGGAAAVLRALAWLIDRDPGTLEPSIGAERPTAAFNITVLSHLLGTPLEPDLSGHVLMLEDVDEHMYRIDRALFHITSQPSVRQVAGIRLGRVSRVPPNEPAFGLTEEDVVRHWCDVSGIPYLGRADIGHDVANKIVPFGAPNRA